MTEAEDSTNRRSVRTIRSLKYLASTVEFFEGNSLLHLIVLDESYTNSSVIKESVLNGVLTSISGDSVNELNDDGYSALHLAVMKENVFMVEKLLSCVRNIDVNLNSDTCAKEEWWTGKNSALHLAANLGNVSIIKKLLKKGVDVNVKNGLGITALQLAIVSHNLETVRFLIKKGATVNTPDYNWSDTYHYAIEYYCSDIFKELLNSDKVSNCNIIRQAACCGNAEAVQILVDKGYPVDEKSEKDNPALHLAVRSGDFKTIECLINNGADVNAVNQRSESVLHIAGEFCDPPTFKFLFDMCTDDIKSDSTLLPRAAKSGHIEKVKLLLKINNIVINIDKHFSLHQAILSGDSETINLLVNMNADVNRVNDGGESPLHLAIKSGNLRVVFFLLNKGAVLNVQKDFSILCVAAQSGDLAVVEFISYYLPFLNIQDKDGNTPLYYAVSRNHVEVIKALLDRGANIDAFNSYNNPLHTAALCNHIDAAQILLERGCQVNAEDISGYSPIIHALENNLMFDSDMVNLLKQWGAVIDGSRNGNTSLHYACLMPDFKQDIFNSLLKSTADACSVNATGMTPLHCAAKSNNVGVMRLLLEKGADLNAKDAQGDTPLHYASRAGHAKFVKALLKRRAEVDVQGLRGRTPLHLAVIFSENDVVKALLHSGANENILDEFGKTAYRYEEEYEEGSEDVPTNERDDERGDDERDDEDDPME